MLLTEFVSGSIFGAALLAAGVYAPSVIKAQMAFSSNVMVTVMMGASASSAIIFEVADRFGWVTKPRVRRPPSNLGLFAYDGNTIGGVMIGIGMAATGACPGTVLVQLSTGTRRAILVALGGVLGALAFTRLQPAMRRARRRAEERDSNVEQDTNSSDNPLKGSPDIAAALSIDPLHLLGVWMFMCLAVVSIAHGKDSTVRQIPATALVSPKYGGLLIGLAQLCTMLLSRHALGASTAYQDFASWLDQKVLLQATDTDNEERPLLTPSVVFVTGMLFSSAIVSQITGVNRLLKPLGSDTNDIVATAVALFGGACMLFGARLAGGCPSGHGISGLAAFSLSSLVSTAAMFAGGVVTSAAIRSASLISL